MQNDVVVELLGGVYQVTTPLQFGSLDSGYNGHTVRYVASSGTTPVLSGGLQIQNWTLHDANLGIYQASVPAGFDTRQLYVNGVRAQRARLNIANAIPYKVVLGDGATTSAQGYSVTIPGMTSWTNVQNIEVFANNWWEVMRCPVASISSGTITMQQPCWSNEAQTFVNKSHGYGLNWLENAYEFLTQPGQWYLNKSTNTIYYMPRTGENMATAKVVAGSAQQLITGAGSVSNNNPVFVQNITFQGLTFAYATWLAPNTSVGYAPSQSGEGAASLILPANVYFTRAKNISFVGNTFLHLGATALGFTSGCQNILIQGNYFGDLSGSAILMGDQNDGGQTNTNLQTTNNTISNNYTLQTGVEYMDAPAISVFYGSKITIAQNEISTAPADGITMGWGFSTPSYQANNTVSQNYIHDVVQFLFDQGGIYTNGQGTGTTLTGNYLDHIGTTSGVCNSPTVLTEYHGYSAIYHDEGGTNFTDTNNVVTNMACGGYWLFLQSGDTSNHVTSSYVDTDLTFQCLPYTAGPSSCLNGVGNNVVSGVTVFGSNPNSIAKATMSAAGLSAPYQGIKNTVITSSLY